MATWPLGQSKKSDDFGLILTDITMPKMGGEELIAEVTKRNLRIPIMVLSALGNDDIIIRCACWCCRLTWLNRRILMISTWQYPMRWCNQTWERHLCRL